MAKKTQKMEESLSLLLEMLPTWSHCRCVYLFVIGAFSVFADNPETTSLTAKNLKRHSYAFTVTARTAVGECGSTNITATLNSQST